MTQQETLVEVIERVFKKHSNNTSLSEGEYDYMMDKEDFKEASLEIANWQKQKMFSEEEVITLLQKYRYDLSSGKTPNIGDTTKIWFEQNKSDIFNFDNIK